MTTSRSSRTLLASAVAATVLAGALSAPAEAAGPRLRPVVTKYAATVAACKTVVDGGDRVRLSVRLDNNSNGQRSSTTAILRDGEPTGKRLDIPYLRPGTSSKVRSITFDRGGRVTVYFGINAEQYGGGPTIALSTVRAC
ncbi:hypothetical protein [Nocardioides rubriscoriae]|uniref:hypothetical protein n=1 Tax=Nocardioides rubriscoriae TaxID=642762 RepID=UPI0011DF50B3|nr:hypothetical protein [Nocardioides rubriscoriae]